MRKANEIGEAWRVPDVLWWMLYSAEMKRTQSSKISKGAKVR